LNYNYNYNTANVIILKENNRVQARSTDCFKFQMKAAVGNHQTLSIMAVGSRPLRVIHDRQLYGKQFSDMVFISLPRRDRRQLPVNGWFTLDYGHRDRQ